jgi:hypothetical protein
MIREHPKYEKILTSIFQFDSIRVHKFIHMAQDLVITMGLCFYAAIYLNKLFVATRDENNEIIENPLTLHLKLLAHILCVIIVLYYVRKITKLIPFVLNFNKNYDPFHVSKDGENLIGKTTAISLVFGYTQSNLNDRLIALIKWYSSRVH